MHDFHDLKVLARVFECIECISFGFKVKRLETWILNRWVLKNRILVFIGQIGFSWYPCVGTTFRKFEHVSLTYMLFVDVWLCRK